MTTATLADLAPQGATNHSALTPLHWWDHCAMPVYGVERSATLAPIAAAFVAGGAQGVIDATKGGTRNGHVCRAWELAMTAVHGPVGTHETQGEHPEVLKAKARALADLRTYLSV